MTRPSKSDPIAQPFLHGVAKPAVRTLVAAGYTSLEQLTKAREADNRWPSRDGASIRHIFCRLHPTHKEYP